MRAFYRFISKPLLVLGYLMAFSSCSYVKEPLNWTVDVVSPYRVEVVQGNFVSKEQVQVLKPGMPREQVRDILGTPLVTSLFHADRWDYAFTIRRQGTPPQQRKFSVYFANNLLVRFDGDDLPTESEFAAGIDNKISKSRKIPKLELSESEINAIKPIKKTEQVQSLQTAPVNLNYPPLESPSR